METGQFELKHSADGITLSDREYRILMHNFARIDTKMVLLKADKNRPPSQLNITNTETIKKRVVVRNYKGMVLIDILTTKPDMVSISNK